MGRIDDGTMGRIKVLRIKFLNSSFPKLVISSFHHFFNSSFRQFLISSIPHFVNSSFRQFLISSIPLHTHRNTHPAADAKRGKAFFCIPPAHFMQQAGEDAEICLCARCLRKKELVWLDDPRHSAGSDQAAEKPATSSKRSAGVFG
jgi:hypothetical protein